jgi:hypothetical protein
MAFVSDYFITKFVKDCEDFRKQNNTDKETIFKFLNNYLNLGNLGEVCVDYNLLCIIFLDKIINQKSYFKREFKVQKYKHKVKHNYEINLIEVYYLSKHLKVFGSETEEFLSRFPNEIQQFLISYFNGYNIFGVDKGILKEFWDMNNLSEYIETEFDVLKHYYDFPDIGNNDKKDVIAFNNLGYYIMTFLQISKLKLPLTYYCKVNGDKIIHNFNDDNIEFKGLVENFAKGYSNILFLVKCDTFSRKLNILFISNNTALCRYFMFDSYGGRTINIKTVKSDSNKLIKDFEKVNSKLSNIIEIPFTKNVIDFVYKENDLLKFILNNRNLDFFILNENSINLLTDIKFEQGIITEVERNGDLIVYNSTNLIEIESKAQKLKRFIFTQDEYNRSLDLNIYDKVDLLFIQNQKGYRLKYLSKNLKGENK